MQFNMLSFYCQAFCKMHQSNRAIIELQKAKRKNKKFHKILLEYKFMCNKGIHDTNAIFCLVSLRTIHVQNKRN